MLFWFFYYIVNISTRLNTHRDRHQKTVNNIPINMVVHTKGTHTIQTMGTGLHETGQGNREQMKVGKHYSLTLSTSIFQYTFNSSTQSIITFLGVKKERIVGVI